MSDVDRPDPSSDDGRDEPGAGGEPDPGSRPNPFAGTPLEQLMSAFTSGQGAGAAGGMPDLNALMAQMQRVFAGHDGSVNWELAKEVARSAVAQTKDPTPSAVDRTAVEDAVRLAELWLDRPPPVRLRLGAGPSGSRQRCRCGSDWWSRWQAAW
jgi:hypothetical protein